MLSWRPSRSAVLPATAAAVVLVAALLRLPNLASPAQGLLPSEALVGLRALPITPSAPLAQGHGPLVPLVVALLHDLGLGPVVAVRLVGAGGGVAATAVLLRLWWNRLGPAAALLAGGWCSVAATVVVANRIGDGAALDPLLLSLTMLAASRARELRRAREAVVTGVLLSLSLWSGAELLLPALAIAGWMAAGLRDDADRVAPAPDRVTGRDLAALRRAADLLDRHDESGAAATTRGLAHRLGQTTTIADRNRRLIGAAMLGAAPLCLLLLAAVIVLPSGYAGAVPGLGSLPTSLGALLESITGLGGDLSAAAGASTPLVVPPLLVPLGVGIAAALLRRRGAQESLLLLLLLAALPGALLSGATPIGMLALLPACAGLIGLGAVSLAQACLRQGRPATIGASVLAVGAVALSSLAVGLQRAPAAEAEYQATDGSGLQLASASNCGAACLVVATAQQRSVIAYVDDFTNPESTPTVLPPGRAIAWPAAYQMIVATSPSAVSAAVGSTAVSHAIGFDPSGNPMVVGATP